jgi:hypothetical protein
MGVQGTGKAVSRKIYFQIPFIFTYLIIGAVILLQ